MKHQPIKVTPHLFQLGTKSFPVYLSMGDEGMIIEGGTGPTFDIIVSQIESLGIDPFKIKYVALTHTHADHVGAIPYLKNRFPHLKVLASSIADKTLRKERFIKEFIQTDKMISRMLIEKGDILVFPPEPDKYIFAADSIINEGDKIDLGKGIIWNVFKTPGHSPCHISLFEENEKNLAIGDVTGYFDPELDIFWPNYFFSLKDYCESIKKMMTIPAVRVLLSHNGAVTIDSKTYFTKALAAVEKYHLEMLERGNNGESKEEICTDKTDWINSIGALATNNVLMFLCGIMLKSSLESTELDLFS